MNWDQYFDTFPSSANDFIVAPPGYYRNISKLFQQIFSNDESIIAYKAILVAEFVMHDNIFADYTRKFLSGNTCQRELVSKMLNRIISEFEKNLNQLTWLDNTTRAQALKKAELFSINIGGPDFDYSFPQIPTSENFFASLIQIAAVICSDYLHLVSLPIDRAHEPWERTRFLDSPVNAFYDPSQNGIFIETPIIDDAFFIEAAPLFYQYGCIGMVMGHEMTHGFDNVGRFYDSFEGRKKTIVFF